MKFRLALTFLITAAALLMKGNHAQAADQTTVAYIPHDKMRAALDNKADIHLLVADNLMVEGNYRDKPGTVEVHTQLTDIFYVTDGATTIVAGGTLEGGKQIAPGQIRGGTISGGTSYKLVKGDTIVIPAGIPHWFKEVSAPVSYFVVKIVRN